MNPEFAANLFVAMICGAGMGGLCGWIPHRAAMQRNNPQLALISMLTCIGLGAFGGCLLALPAAWIFKLVIVSQGEKATVGLRGYDGLSMTDYAQYRAKGAFEPSRQETAPYMEIGHIVTCNDCRFSCSKDANGQVPPECPKCGLKFRRRRETDTPPPVAKRVPRATQVPTEPEEQIVDLQSARP